MATRPAFQRRHFRAVAEIIRRARLRPNDDITETLDDIEEDFADLFRESNPRFSAPKFYAACDPTYNVVEHHTQAVAVPLIRKGGDHA